MDGFREVEKKVRSARINKHAEDSVNLAIPSPCAVLVKIRMPLAPMMRRIKETPWWLFITNLVSSFNHFLRAWSCCIAL